MTVSMKIVWRTVAAAFACVLTSAFVDIGNAECLSSEFIHFDVWGPSGPDDSGWLLHRWKRDIEIVILDYTEANLATKEIANDFTIEIDKVSKIIGIKIVVKPQYGKQESNVVVYLDTKTDALYTKFRQPIMAMMQGVGMSLPEATLTYQKNKEQFEKASPPCGGMTSANNDEGIVGAVVYENLHSDKRCVIVMLASLFGIENHLAQSSDGITYLDYNKMEQILLSSLKEEYSVKLKDGMTSNEVKNAIDWRCK